MTQNSFNWLLAIFVLAIVATARAQEAAKMPRIGYLAGFGNAKDPGAPIDAFRQGLETLVMPREKIS